MSSTLLIEKNSLLTSCNDVDQVCQPLKHIGITYFSFVRTYQDGSHIRLSNNPASWTQHYYKRGFYNFVIDNIPDKNGNILWSNIERYPLFFEAAEYFDVDNGTVMVLRYEDMVERYFFGSNRKNKSVNNIYLHKIDLLKRFILFFREKASTLIDAAEKSKLILPNRPETNPFILKPDKIALDFEKSVSINKTTLRISGKNIHVNLTEAKILACIKQGLSSKQIAKKLDLKPKTIEIYRANLKQKILAEVACKDILLELHKNPLLDMDIL